MKNKLIWVAPISVIAFIIFLTVMYSLVGEMENIVSEKREVPEAKPANQVLTVNPQDNQADAQQGQLVNNAQFPAGIGNNQIQLINKPTFPAGIGNGQIQLIKQNQPQINSAYFGANITEVPQAVSNDLKIAPEKGVYIKSVLADSPAEKAGIKAFDVILKFDHQKIVSHEQIGQILSTKKDGDIVKVIINRDGREKSFHVKLDKVQSGLVQAAAVQKPSPVTWMGADIQNIDAVMKMQFNLPDKNGVVISDVTAKSPAQISGLISGDVIKRFNGTRIRDVKQFQDIILSSQPGDKAQITVLRNGQNLAVPVVLATKPNIPEKIPFIGAADMAIEASWIGMDVSELSPNGARDLGLPQGTSGILVTDVEGPPATTVGFQANDVITSVNGVPTPEMKQFVEATEKQTSAVVDIIRGNRHFFITIPTPGYTQQGTKLNTGLSNKLKQVAATIQNNNRLAIFADNPDINSTISGDVNKKPYLILVDLANNGYAIVDKNNLNSMSNLIDQYNINALICSDISKQTANDMTAKGVAVYSGVVGTPVSAISLYESNCLVSMKGF